MATTPLYAEKLHQQCCSPTADFPPEAAAKLAALESKLEQQQNEINTLKEQLTTKIEQADLITVHSLENQPLFKAFPLGAEAQTGEHNDSEN